MHWKSLALSLALSAQDTQAASASSLMARQFAQSAMMRFQCNRLTIDRIDPLVQPGQTPSVHLHQIVGGNSFNASMPPVSYDPSTLSTCTSCTYSEGM